MPSKAEIRVCPDFLADIAAEERSGATMDEFLSRFETSSDEEEIDIFTLLYGVQDYRRECRDKTAAKLIASNGGDACGLELAQGDGKLACILPEPSWRGGYRLSLYDINGPFTHEIYTTPEEALDEAIKLNYRTFSPGALDKLTELPSWKKGLEFVLTLMKGGNPFIQT
ncbi:hypothetical protein E4188_22280 (plasmid) [Aeromonas media]|uniref:Immunity protein Imm1 n=1 Tax=Aeromonas media TaxID=651 RepID=A0ABX6P0P6_AERME|nr:hypothetical protein [Aeromonas media]QJT37004.1 hypothetical protein E4187_22180 [Aeromonas media]QJT41230.1 hypothetical protein E4188_22280 [Aeromonas media]